MKSCCSVPHAALLAMVALALPWSVSSVRGAPPAKATVIDLFGNRHELKDFKVRGKTDIEYYIGERRRVISTKEIDRFRLDGQRGDEERPIRVQFRDGRIDTGVFVVGGDATPHHENFGGGRLSSQVSGRTNLGPFLLQLGDLREVILHHAESSKPTALKVLAATLVDEEGTLFEVENFSFRETTDLVFRQGRKRRSVDMSKVAKIAFAEASSGQEFRPITVTLWSGESIQGNMEAGRARFSGETDRMFHRRIGSAFTGNTASGAFAIGLHNVRLIMFKPSPEAGVEADASVGVGGDADAASFQANQPPRD